MKADHVRDIVRSRYAAVATAPAAESCCGVTPSQSVSACGCTAPSIADMSRRMGYQDADLDAASVGNLGLGCGNPQAIARMQPGEIVLDLGSGAGFDAFLAARQVGAGGRVIGVDMTHEMLAKARANASTLALSNVEFRLGEIENLPVADACVDVIISNCVINLSPDKPRVMREAFRVLKSGGRLAISDVVMMQPLPAELADRPDLLAGCVGGAATVGDLRQWLQDAGFVDIAITPKPQSHEVIREWAPGLGIENYVASATIEASKPYGEQL